MKCNFSEDEWYPVYSYEPIEDEYRIEGSMELSEEELQNFLKCYKEFSVWQKRLRDTIRGY